MEKYTNQFTSEEIFLINQLDSEQPFRVLQITNSEDLNVLRTPSLDVVTNDLNLARLIQRMHATVTFENSKGVGIAAPQIGINKKVILVQRIDKKERAFEFYVNPKIIWRSDILNEGEEGCLSIPDAYKAVKRNLVVTIEYQNLEGSYFTETVEGYVAVIFQHEIDHLNGVLFIDYLEDQSQINYIKAHEKNALFYQNEI